MSNDSFGDGFDKPGEFADLDQKICDDDLDFLDDDFKALTGGNSGRNTNKDPNSQAKNTPFGFGTIPELGDMKGFGKYRI